MMKILLKLTLLNVLLQIGMQHAFADTNYRQDWREDIRLARNEQRDSVASDRERSAEEKRVRNATFDSVGNPQPVPEEQQSRRANESVKNGRMTQEERRALRRQINEAGRDLYSPAH